MSETEPEREKRATELAYAQGRREADVDSHLRSHEKRLNAINGSIEKHARNAASLEARIGEVHDSLETKIDAIIANQETREAIEADRVAQIKKANESQISTRMFLVGVAAIIATILGAFISSGHL